MGWHQLAGRIQGSQVHFDFVRAACKNRRAAAGTEKTPGVVACFAIDRHRILRKHRGSVEKGAMMLAAVETVANANPVWESRRHNFDVAAQAAAGESVHAASPLKSSWEWLQRTTLSLQLPLQAGRVVSSAAGDSDHRFQANRAYDATSERLGGTGLRAACR
ncbi:hypothetical protein MESS2_1170004 [Mesorhizobium metallidurans STM 2683]|uniref:Uncharacterized protein n=1 Tax=Mesorhizobium metallidurans STM 2683 TaxID=1297569 RepID=M5EWE0_9HYPH|nr:hypothetical protein MESS2_1170004 [Mesorhizobium metallidurans STM 2683]